MYIGLTGNIASGKSTAAKYFNEFGCYTIDADEIGKIVMSPGGDAYDLIIQEFGKNILNSDGFIDREKLKKLIFNDMHKKSALEQIVHPAIHRLEKKLISQIKGKDDKAIIITHAALIIENNSYERFDHIIVVYVSKYKQIERLLERDNMSMDLANKIINSQMPIDKKLEKADFIINNDHDLNNLRLEVKRILDLIKILNYCAKHNKNI